MLVEEVLVLVRNTITGKELDRRFNDGEDIIEFLDFDKATRLNPEQRRVNLDLPIWMIKFRTAQQRELEPHDSLLMKVWISEKVKVEQAENLHA